MGERCAARQGEPERQRRRRAGGEERNRRDMS
jgi:hypothetical protein